MDAALDGFADVLALQHRLHDLEKIMAEGENSDAVLNDYGHLRDQYEHQGGYATEARAKAILFGLGFCETDLKLPTQVLSGGQKNRLVLGQLLAREPDLLLLDEPTNHLDLQAIEWLEYFLSEYDNAFVIISHDRTFLERTVTKIADLERGVIEQYSGNYSFYIEEKEQRRAQQQKAYRAQQAHIARTEEYIRRNIAGQKTKQAQSRRRALEKLDRVERVVEQRDIALKFNATTRGGDRVLQVEHLSKAYPNRPLFSDLSFTLWQGERLGIIGPNGSGKSVLLKIFMEQLVPDSGRAILGKGLEIGYYAQTRQDLNPNLSVLEEIWSLTPSVPEEEIRNFLGAFLFSGDDVERETGSLSGGEQSRRCPGQAHARTPQFAGARRTHQPSGYRLAPCARKRAGGFFWDCDRGFARPVFSQPHGQSPARARRREVATGRWQLRLLSASDAGGRNTGYTGCTQDANRLRKSQTRNAAGAKTGTPPRLK